MKTLHVFDSDPKCPDVQEWAKDRRAEGSSVRIVTRIVRACGERTTVAVAILEQREK
jgi:hypothetical protein